MHLYLCPHSKVARYITAGIKNYYLNNTMAHFQYMKIPINHITQEMRDEYNINNIALDDHVHTEIRKGIYILKEAGILAFNQLVTHLSPL